MENKIALVTGAGSEKGIGRAIAHELGKKGATVIIADINIEWANNAAKELRDIGYKSTAIRIDVSSRESVDSAIKESIEEYGKIDILINNAGISRSTAVMDITDEEWNLIMDINLKGVFYCTQAVLPSMKFQNYGRIVNISSVAGKQGGGIFGTAHYAASKAGVLGFSKAVAREVATHQITVNSVTPGLIETEITAEMSLELREKVNDRIPIKRPGLTKEVASAVGYLASAEASYITGEEIDVNGGFFMD